MAQSVLRRLHTSTFTDLFLGEDVGPAGTRRLAAIAVSGFYKATSSAGGGARDAAQGPKFPLFLST